MKWKKREGKTSIAMWIAASVHNFKVASTSFAVHQTVDLLLNSIRSIQRLLFFSIIWRLKMEQIKNIHAFKLSDRNIVASFSHTNTHSLHLFIHLCCSSFADDVAVAVDNDDPTCAWPCIWNLFLDRIATLHNNNTVTHLNWTVLLKIILSRRLSYLEEIRYGTILSIQFQFR